MTIINRERKACMECMEGSAIESRSHEGCNKLYKQPHRFFLRDDRALCIFSGPIVSLRFSIGKCG